MALHAAPFPVAATGTPERLGLLWRGELSCPEPCLPPELSSATWRAGGWWAG